MAPVPTVDAPVVVLPRVHGRGQPPAALTVRRALRRVHEVIDRRAVDVVFEPMVRPSTGDVIGLEASVRGGRGTAFTTSRSLRQAAAAVGRLGELDWIGRAATARALAARDIDPMVTVFFEADGRVLYEPCPADCFDALRQLLRRRCVVRLDPGHSSTLAHAMVAGMDQLRALGFDLALDGPPMGVPSGSMLRCFEPELVTVDARALVALAASDGPRAVPSLGEFYRRTGRELVARHVEDAAGLHAARTIGAAFAQGPHHGGPVALAGTHL